MNAVRSAARVSALSGHQLAFYRANGYLIVPNLVRESFLVAVQEVLELLVDDTISTWRRSGLIRDSFSDLDFGSRYHRAWIEAGRPPRGDTALDDRFSPRALERHVPPDQLATVAAVAAEAMGAERVTTLTSSFYRARFPDDLDQHVPWHQDVQCMTLISPEPFVTAWIPLVDVSSVNSCLEVSPVGPLQAALDPVWSPRSRYVCMHQSDVDALAATRPMCMYRGDVLLMSPYLPHRARTNFGAQIRWSIDLRYRPT